MLDSIRDIGVQLRKARQKKGLSQRAFSLLIGIPQSHISRIENGQVDLQISSLIAITRMLDLELMLVQRQLVPAVQALHRSLRTDTQMPAYDLGLENE